MNAFDLLVNTLESSGYKVHEQGSLPGEYPDKLLTFWERESESVMYYSNAEHAYTYLFDVNFYTSDREHMQSDFEKIIKGLKGVGFIVSGKGYSVPSDVNTHFGRGISVQYIESE